MKREGPRTLKQRNKECTEIKTDNRMPNAILSHRATWIRETPNPANHDFD